MWDQFSLTELCQALGVSRSGYHTARRPRATARAQANAQLIEQMNSIHAHRHTRCYGSPRMTRELAARGHACSKKPGCPFDASPQLAYPASPAFSAQDHHA